MADEEEVKQPEKIYVTALDKLEDFTAGRDNAEKVTAVVFHSSLDEFSAAALAAFKEAASDAAYEKMTFYSCDVNAHAEIAKEAKISGLPAYAWYFSGEAVEGFTGNNVEKVKVATKAAELKKNEALVARAKAAEEAEKKRLEEEKAAADAAKAAEEAAAAAAAAN